MARRRYLDESRPSMDYVRAIVNNTNPETGRVNYEAIAVPWNSTPTRRRTANTKKKNNTRWVPKTKEQALRSLGETKKYTIQANDTLSKIDSKRWRDIAIANGISDPNKIQVGQEIDIPKDAGTPSESAASESTKTKDVNTPTHKSTNERLISGDTSRARAFGDQVMSRDTTVRDTPAPRSTSANQDYGAAKIGLFTTPNEVPYPSKPTSATEAIPISNPITNLASYVHTFTPRGQQELANTRLNEVRAEMEKDLGKAKTLDEQLAISRQYSPTIRALTRAANPNNYVISGEPGLGLVFPELALVNPAVKTAHKLFNIAYDRGEQAIFDYRLGKPNVQSSIDDVLDLYNGPSQSPIGNRSWYEHQPAPAQPRQVQVGYYNNPVTITRPGTYSSPQTQVGIPSYRRGIDFSRVGGRPRTYISPGVGPRRLATARPKQTYVEPEVNAMSWDGGGFYNIRGVGEPRVNFRYPDNVVMLNENALTNAKPKVTPSPKVKPVEKPTNQKVNTTPENNARPNKNSSSSNKNNSKQNKNNNQRTMKDVRRGRRKSLGGAIPLW